MDKEATIAKAGAMVFEGAGPEKVVSFLHQSGLDQLDSILALRRVFAMSVPEAKEALAKSAAWADSREQVEAAAEQAIKVVATEQNQS